MHEQDCIENQEAAPGWRFGPVAHWALLALAPLALLLPTGSSILIVPLVPSTADASLVWASQAGARFMGAGPLPGSILIEAAPGRVLLPAFRHGALLLRSGASGCGIPGGELT